ncbi:MAG: translation initiation factor [Saprospiraceae bacterium]
MSKKNNRKDGLIFSTDPDFDWNAGEETEAPSDIEPGKQNLRVAIDRKQRGGKEVTVISGFIGSDEKLETLGKMLKTKCGTGGSVKDGLILIQGNMRDKVMALLLKEGYSKTKKSGG